MTTKTKLLRWLMVTAIIFISLNCLAQRNNTWLYFSLPLDNKLKDSIYCIDFNYCPPKYYRSYFEIDKQIRKIHTLYGVYTPLFINSFCDTLGNLAFTELLGQHYYNKSGKLYDSSYIQNRYDKFANRRLYGSAISANNRTYYFKAYNQIYYTSQVWKPGWLHTDSVIICVSEFDNIGNLLKKNVPIYSMPIDKSFGLESAVNLFKAYKINDTTSELFLSLYSNNNSNICMNYNLNTQKISPKESLEMDSVFIHEYDTKLNKIATSKFFNGITFFEPNGVNGFNKLGYIDFNKYSPPKADYHFKEVYDICFSPNDSIVYISTHYYKDTAYINKPEFAYIIAFNYYKPYTDYKYIELPSTLGQIINTISLLTD